MSGAVVALQPDGDLTALPAQINRAVGDAERHARGAMQSALRAGNLLTQAKRLVAHGEWETWVSANCDCALRTAQAYMRLSSTLPELPEPEAQRVADLPLRDAIRAISTSPTAPPRHPSTHRPSRDCRERAADALKKAADAQRALVRNIATNYVRRDQVERTRAKLQAALAVLDELQADGEAAQ